MFAATSLIVRSAARQGSGRTLGADVERLWNADISNENGNARV